jgi:cellulose synthase/poly-beta-1,6-N-acetylglucosamine synthase-like glycosyltransferase
MVLLFWSSVAIVAYVYAGYPLLLYCGLRIADCGLRITNCGLFRSRRSAIRNPQSSIRHDGSAIRTTESAIRNPQSAMGVSIVIAARNEAALLGPRIENLLSLDYPADRRQIIVVSDGSTDGTLDVLSRYPGVVDAVTVPAGGKAVALNAGVARATFDIVVFADARQTFAPDALQELVAPFADPAIGAVSGELLLDAESACRRLNRERRTFERRRDLRAQADDRRLDDRRVTARSTIADGVGLYWKYEKQLRRMESAVDSTLGATGAIYAMRRSLFAPLPADTLLDDVLAPMRVVLSGSRVVFNERALAFDRASVDADAETRRKVRTLAGNYQILALEPRLLLPWRNRVWLQYVSHKLGRLIVPYALLGAFASSLALASVHVFYLLALAAQVGFYLLAGCGAIIEYRGRIADGHLAASQPPLPEPMREVA